MGRRAAPTNILLYLNTEAIFFACLVGKKSKCTKKLTLFLKMQVSGFSSKIVQLKMYYDVWQPISDQPLQLILSPN